MPDINVLKFTDAGLNEIHKLLLDAPTRIGMPLLQDIDAQLRAAAAESDKLAADAKAHVASLETQIAALRAAATAGARDTHDTVEVTL